MKTVTVNDVMSWNPCEEYTEDIITELFDGRETMTALDALDLKIPIKDILWVALMGELIPAEILHEFGCRCADRALSLIENPDKRSLDAVIAKRKWLKGEITDEKLSVARSAARVAAWSATRATYAARVAARVAARDATRSVAGPEVMHVTSELENKWQVAELKKMLKEEVE